MRVGRTVGAVFLGLVMPLAGGASMAQSSASAFVSSGEPVRAAIGTFVFEQGSSLAVELARQEPCPCLCKPLFVTGMRVLDAEGNPVFVAGQEEQTVFPVPFEEWTGSWVLVNQHGDPVGVGTHSVIVQTTIGEFSACIDVVAPGTAALAGHVSSQAVVCGVELFVYRLVEETASGQQIALREGQRLMVALSGNPTTGYEWEVESEPSGILQRIEGPSYRSSSSLIGAGGTFYFRYEAVAAGQGDLTFVYRRPWETAPPERTFSVRVVVR